VRNEKRELVKLVQDLEEMVKDLAGFETAVDELQERPDLKPGTGGEGPTEGAAEVAEGANRGRCQ
jgi:hypothetical protein